MPAQHGELAGGAGGSDLHATASADALIEGRSGPGAMEADQMAPASMLRAWAGPALVIGHGWPGGRRTGAPRVEPEVANQPIGSAEPGEVTNGGHD